MSEKKQSFFNLGTGIDPTKNGKVKSAANKIGCDACRLKYTCNSPEIEPVGEGQKKILIITEYPGEYEDSRGKVFSKAGRKLVRKILDEIEIDLDVDCWSMFAVRCSTEEYEAPTDREIDLCRPKLLSTIERLNPDVIITLGEISIKALIHHRISGRLTGTKMGAFFGECIPDQELEKYICPTYSVEWLLDQTVRENGGDVVDPVLLRFFKRALKNGAKKAGQGFYKHNYASEIMTTKDPKEAVKWIDAAIKKRIIAYHDYESDGLKPHAEGHELSTASFSDGLFGYAFPFFYEDKDFLRAWYRLMQSKHTRLAAHKMDFENMWTKERSGFGKFAKHWEWDTCLGAHVVNSQKPTGEKFYVYVYLGILNYDDSVDKYLKASKADMKKYGTNAYNKIHKANLDKLLLYNGQDSHFGYKIMEIQKTKLKGKFLKGFKFFLKGAETLSWVQSEGMCVNVEKMEKHEKILTRKIDRAYNKVKDNPEWDKWRGSKEFNPNSDAQLSRMLYDILKYKKPKKGASATDKKQLERIGTDFTKSIIPYRELKKMRDTYIAQFKREQVDGLIRPFFNLHIPVTFRSSSDSPNFQNMPARDLIALKWVMSLIEPRPGNKIIEWDYKGVEVTISACYHKDPNMIKYIKNPKNDMHGDTTADCYLCKPNEVSKAERQNGKGDFVFPSFYGSGVAKIAPALWEHTTPERKLDLKDKGIKKYRDFYAHMEDVYRIFWDERFPVYKEWKQKTWHDYLKKGYVDLYTGFRYYGPASFTQITNTQIQGSAFHVLLWSLTNIYPEVKANYNNSRIIGQIHDAAVGDIHPADESGIDAIVKKWGTEKVREHWDWITLPLKLEKESTEIDGTWNTMKGRGFI